MKAFISYSIKDRKRGAAVKSILKEIEVESFLAHNDLHVSEEWKKRILEELRVCNIFIPILSKAFRASDWCGQEAGIIAKRRGVVIIPLSLDGTKPYGFISHIQGKPLRKGRPGKTLLLEALAKKQPGYVIDQLLKPMERVYSFRAAESIVEQLVPYFAKFTASQANKFAVLATANGQIWDASLCRTEYLPNFLESNKAKLRKTVYGTLKKKIQYT